MSFHHNIRRELSRRVVCYCSASVAIRVAGKESVLIRITHSSNSRITATPLGFVEPVSGDEKPEGRVICRGPAVFRRGSEGLRGRDAPRNERRRGFGESGGLKRCAMCQRVSVVRTGRKSGFDRPSLRAIGGKDVPCSRIDVTTIKKTRLKIIFD